MSWSIYDLTKVHRLTKILPCSIKLVTLRGDFPALFPSLTPQSELVDNTYSCSLPNFERFLYYSLCRIVADDPKLTISLVLPWVIKLVTLRCELETRPGLALGPLGAPESDSTLNFKSRIHLTTFYCRFDGPDQWSPAYGPLIHGSSCRLTISDTL